MQALGGSEEDTDGGFKHGGWSMKFFDPEVMGGTYDELASTSDTLLQGRRTYQVSARRGRSVPVPIEPIVLGGGKVHLGG